MFVADYEIAGCKHMIVRTDEPVAISPLAVSSIAGGPRAAGPHGGVAAQAWSTGLSELDRMLDGIRPDDNIVWQIEALNDDRSLLEDSCGTEWTADCWTATNRWRCW